jgi:ATP-dependent Lhr-like helicase
VKGLGGAQFALPHAVERLRSASLDTDPPFIVMAASDPANPYSLALEGIERDPLARPRGSGALLITRAGRVAVAVEGRGRRLTIAPDLTPAEITEGMAMLAAHLTQGDRSVRRSRGVRVDTIDGRPALSSPHIAALQAAGFRRETSGLRYLRDGFASRTPE